MRSAVLNPAEFDAATNRIRDMSRELIELAVVFASEGMFAEVQQTAEAVQKLSALARVDGLCFIKGWPKTAKSAHSEISA